MSNVTFIVPIELSKLPYIRVWHSQFSTSRGEANLHTSAANGKQHPKTIALADVETLSEKVGHLVRRGRVVLVPVSVIGCVGWTAYILPD